MSSARARKTCSSWAVWSSARRNVATRRDGAGGGGWRMRGQAVVAVAEACGVARFRACGPLDRSVGAGRSATDRSSAISSWRRTGVPGTASPAAVAAWPAGSRRGRRERRSGSRAAAPAHRPAERPPDDVDHLVDVLVGLAALGGRPDAALDVVLEDEDRERVDGGPQRGGLLEDVDAVLLALDHPGDPADLALHPRQPADEAGLVLRVAMAEVIAVPASVGARPSACATRGLLVVGRAGRGVPPALRRMIPPGGIGRDGTAGGADGGQEVDFRPMDPRDARSTVRGRGRLRRLWRTRPRPSASGSSPAATTSTFVEIDLRRRAGASPSGCRSPARDDRARGGRLYGEFLPADDDRFRDARPIDVDDVLAVRRLLEHGDLDALVGRRRRAGRIRRGDDDPAIDGASRRRYRRRAAAARSAARARA